MPAALTRQPKPGCPRFQWEHNISGAIFPVLSCFILDSVAGGDGGDIGDAILIVRLMVMLGTGTHSSQTHTYIKRSLHFSLHFSLYVTVECTYIFSHTNYFKYNSTRLSIFTSLRNEIIVARPWNQPAAAPRAGADSSPAPVWLSAA